MFTLGLARSTCISEFTGSPCLICLTWFTVDWVGRSVYGVYSYVYVWFHLCICLYLCHCIISHAFMFIYFNLTLI